MAVGHDNGLPYNEITPPPSLSPLYDATVPFLDGFLIWIFKSTCIYIYVYSVGCFASWISLRLGQFKKMASSNVMAIPGWKMKLNVVYILYFLCNERKKKKKKQVSLVRGQVRGKKKIKNKRLVLVVGRKGYITMDNSCCRPWNVSFPRCCCVCYLLLLPLSFLLPLATSKRRVCRYVFLLLPSTARV